MALEAASSPFKRPDDSTVDSCSYTPADVLGTLPLQPPQDRLIVAETGKGSKRLPC